MPDKMTIPDTGSPPSDIITEMIIKAKNLTGYKFQPLHGLKLNTEFKEFVKELKLTEINITKVVGAISRAQLWSG